MTKEDGKESGGGVWLGLRISMDLMFGCQEGAGEAPAHKGCSAMAWAWWWCAGVAWHPLLWVGLLVQACSPRACQGGRRLPAGSYSVMWWCWQHIQCQPGAHSHCSWAGSQTWLLSPGSCTWCVVITSHSQAGRWLSLTTARSSHISPTQQGYLIWHVGAWIGQEGKGRIVGTNNVVWLLSAFELKVKGLPFLRENAAVLQECAWLDWTQVNSVWYMRNPLFQEEPSISLNCRDPDHTYLNGVVCSRVSSGQGT